MTGRGEHHAAHQVDRLTSLRPKCWGANSTPRTVPFASIKLARSTHREPLDELEAPFACGSESEYEVCSHILTVRSKEAEAIIVPNSGCAQLTFVIAASCACNATVNMRGVMPVPKTRRVPSSRPLRSKDHSARLFAILLF